MRRPLSTLPRLAAVAALVALAPSVARADRMSFQHDPPATAQAGKAFEIVGTIFGAGDLARASCRYRNRTGSWRQVDLALEYGTLYRAIVPASEVIPPRLEYYCVAYDYFDSQSELFRTASSPGRVRVGDDKVETGRVEGRRDRRRGTDPEPVAEAPLASAQAQELSLFATEDVVTLATRQAQSVSIAPAIATGVSDELMRQLGLRTLPDVLKTVPGVETSRDVQGFHRLAIRGMRDDSAFLVLYDGHRLNSAYDARAPLFLSVENVERVEVIRGPGSALYGAGAFVGVVNVVSKRREGLEGALAAGSFGSVDGHLSGGMRLGASDWRLYGDGDLTRSDGYRRKIVSDAASDSMEARGAKSLDNPAGSTDDHNLFFNLGVEARHEPRQGGQTRLSARFLRQERGALVGLFDVVGPESKLVWNVALADVSHELPLPVGSLSAHLSFDHQVVDRRFQVAPVGYPLTPAVIAADGLFERTRFAAQTFGADSALNLSIAQEHKLALGLQLSLSRLPSYTYELNFEQGAVLAQLVEPTLSEVRQRRSELNSRLEFGAFAQDVWRVVKRVSLTLGVRMDITQLPHVTTDNNGKPFSIEGTRLVPSLNPRLGLVWEPIDNLNFKLLYGRAFRAPTIEELAQQTPVSELTEGRFEGNPGLSPAIIDTVEAGVEHAFALGGSKVRVRGNGFVNIFTDPIMAVDSFGNITPLSNREPGVTVWGAEGEARYEFGGGAYTLLNCSWFRAVDQAAPEGLQYLTDAPQYRVNAALNLPLNRWVTASVLVQLGAERRNNGRSQLEAQRHFRIPAYTLVSAQLRSEPILEHWEVALSAQNLFDYDLSDDVPRPDAQRMPGLLPREGLQAFLTARARY